ncbi:hypothetical protein E2C01_060136 [Portunus trituberculatus]|uniref:Uncharacterized protein n=1 Tax=Portunus trituberculatus TaxID=210409 RepID=A0A5B7H796_PORTR|nr:hypothetical protein [Portunus trituberculatus]
MRVSESFASRVVGVVVGGYRTPSPPTPSLDTVGLGAPSGYPTPPLFLLRLDLPADPAPPAGLCGAALGGEALGPPLEISWGPWGPWGVVLPSSGP